MPRKHSPLVTVVMPTRNRPNLLLEAVHSVLQQDDPNWELVIVDDGSDIPLSGEQLGDPRVKLVNQEHRLRGAARNHGIKAASGEYIAFLDDDDLYCPEHISVLRTAASEQPASAGFFTQASFWDPVTGSQRRHSASNTDASQQSKAVLLGMFAPLATLCIKKESILEAGGFPEAPKLDGSEDFVFLVRVMRRSPLRPIKRSTVLIREHPDRGMYEIDKIVGSRKEALAQLLVAEALSPDDQRVLAAGTYRFAAALYYHRGDIPSAREELRKARRELAGLKGWTFTARLTVLTMLGRSGSRVVRRLKSIALQVVRHVRDNRIPR